MSNQVIVRPLRPTDEVHWRRLWTAYLDFYDTTLDETVYTSAFARLLSSEAGEYQCLLAEVDGAPVGLAHYLFHRFMWSVEDTCYLMDLFTAPDVRGKGVGRALIDAVHAEARKNNIPTTYWMTEEDNHLGRILYDKVARKTKLIVYEKEDEV